MPYYRRTVTVIIPAFNEAPSIARVVDGLNELRSPEDPEKPLVDEIIVSNNGSTDDTAELARKNGATVCSEFRRGYGYACLRAMNVIKHSNRKKPDYVVFVDGDHSARAQDLPKLLRGLLDGGDLVVGARAPALRESQAISPHQRFGNRLAAELIKLFWKCSVTDLGPFRAIRYSTLLQLDMQDKRFGWTVEMQVKAIQANKSYREVPVTTLDRIGVSKISGTVKGTIGAAVGIFGKIFQLYLNESRFVAKLKSFPE